MKGSFEDSELQVRRLMEIAGGSSNAYDNPATPPSPTPVPQEEPLPSPSKPNPFEDLVDAMAGVQGDEPTPEEEAKFASGLDGICGNALEELAGPSSDSRPKPLGPEYEFSVTVEKGGELSAIWDGFGWAAAEGKPREIQIDSGPATIKRTAEGAWVLEDPQKNRKYLREDGNLAGHLTPGADAFIWVLDLSNSQPDLGYIHNGYVFLQKERS